jgi:hypothetical protein
MMVMGSSHDQTSSFEGWAVAGDDCIATGEGWVTVMQAAEPWYDDNSVTCIRVF